MPCVRGAGALGGQAVGGTGRWALADEDAHRAWGELQNRNLAMVNCEALMPRGETCPGAAALLASSLDPSAMGNCLAVLC